MSAAPPEAPAAAPPPGGEPAAEPLELSIVMPCLDEAETVGTCVRKARSFLEARGIRGEVVVADNGSRDGSPEIARREGARVVRVAERGYGAAIDGGIRAARGRSVIVGDADDSYDFSALDGFVEKLRAGADLVMGNRFRGGVRPGAMPWLHRWVGNPVLSALGRLFFHSRVGDFHCGLRGVQRDAYRRLGLRTTGMEFASEMVVKAALQRMRVEEVPTVLYPDGRSGRPHLRTWRDGWRHLRFMLLFSPRWLFLVPGALLFGAGALVSLWILAGGGRVGDVVFEIHTLLVAGLACLVGFQLVVFAVFTKVFSVTEGFEPMPGSLVRLFEWVRLETGLVTGALVTLAGLAVLSFAVWTWAQTGFGDLDPRRTMRSVIPGSVLIALGVQILFASFFLSALGLRRR